MLMKNLLSIKETGDIIIEKRPAPKPVMRPNGWREIPNDYGWFVKFVF